MTGHLHRFGRVVVWLVAVFLCAPECVWPYCHNVSFHKITHIWDLVVDLLVRCLGRSRSLGLLGKGPLPTTGFAWGLECKRAAKVAISEPGMVPSLSSSVVGYGGGGSSEEESSVSSGYSLGSLFSAMKVVIVMWSVDAWLKILVVLVVGVVLSVVDLFQEGWM